MTRGWPLAPRPGERVDHPHHVGLWFNYESVNGLDFWNNSDDIKPANRSKMGTILHRRIVSAKGGSDHGELTTESDWVMSTGTVLLHERTQFVFAGDASTRTIDRIATLTAVERVVFADVKDGMLGMRVARQLEQPSNEPLVFTDIAGEPPKFRGWTTRASPANTRAARARRATRCGRRAAVGRCWPAVSGRSRSRSR